ncbi:MAG: hypothetical protein LQ343_003074 [Gyalolechia ehrenbergii]|nr:MAG: hypothetical protein LQ343_003074 [Gyalolechia ehrenbergii]
MSSSRSPFPPPPQHLTLHTYHCLCSTHLLTTPYDISTLPQRRSPSFNLARILPLPSTNPPPPLPTDHTDDDGRGHGDKGSGGVGDRNTVLPSLLSSNLKAVRKPIVVQREDGWEKRRMWRCGRCGVGVGYEVVREEEVGEGRLDKVLFLLDGGLVETGRWED